MNKLENLSVKIFADGADKATMYSMYEKSFIKGLTTNPTLMKKAGIVDYRDFCIDVLSFIKDKSLSLEVFSDDFTDMKRQAHKISTWGENVYVKIPITNSKGESSCTLIKSLAEEGVKINVTAITTLTQVKEVMNALSLDTPSYISIFAGRIADTGRDPLPLMKEALSIIKANPMAELIWASPRELLNVMQANDMGCHIITVTADIISKLGLIGYSLEEFSLDTVKMFRKDACDAGYQL